MSLHAEHIDIYFILFNFTCIVHMLCGSFVSSLKTLLIDLSEKFEEYFQIRNKRFHFVLLSQSFGRRSVCSTKMAPGTFPAVSWRQ